MKQVFIDSNIFLNFYDFHDEDLDQLAKFVDLISAEEIKLYLTHQVKSEVAKNRENRLKDAYSKFIDSKATVAMPAFCKHYDAYSDIKRVQGLLNDLRSKLGKQIGDDIQNRSLKADLVIKNIFAASTIIRSDDYLDEAIERHRFGRPPGKKNNSFGDEINWEALLAEVENEGQFIIISQDGDYSSALVEDQLKDALTDEWHAIKPKCEIFYYRSLSAFFSEHDIKIELRIEQEKSDLIHTLINSGSFLTTHTVIKRLNKYASFSEDQIKGLATALQENSQVSWIISDPDVKSFYETHLLPKSDLFDTESWQEIKALIVDDPVDGSMIEEIQAKLEAQGSEDTKNEVDDQIPF